MALVVDDEPLVVYLARNNCKIEFLQALLNSRYNKNERFQKLFDINAIDPNDKTDALYHACKHSNVEMCRILLNNGCNVNKIYDKHSLLPLILKMNHGSDIMDVLNIVLKLPTINNDTTDDINPSNYQNMPLSTLNDMLDEIQTESRVEDVTSKNASSILNQNLRLVETGNTMLHEIASIDDIKSSAIELLLKSQLNECMNVKNKENKTPIMVGIDKNNQIVIETLCSYQQNVENISVESLNDFAYLGNLNDFKQQLYTLIKLKYNIGQWSQLIYNNILTNEKIAEWIGYAKQNKNETIVGFLSSLQSRAVSRKNLTILYTMIDPNNSGKNAKDIENQATKLAYKRAKYLYDKCDNDTLEKLSKVINNGISLQECGFDDSLLFLSKMVNNEEFVNVIETCTKECLSTQSKNVQKYLYFKNNLLFSRVWGTNTTESKTENEAENKIDSNDDSNDNSNDNDSYNTLLFEKIENSVISQELKLQKKYIMNEIIKEESNYLESWNKLKEMKFESLNYEIDKRNGTKVKSKCRQVIKSDYSENELPFDNVNGFNGATEYDNNGYLTKLLIGTHQIDPIFQSDCKRIFLENRDLRCSFSSAPPKTKQRCQKKAEMDYSNEIWPHTCNVIDLVRCSVVFNDSKDLIYGINKFFDIVSKNKGGCIKKILRVKNGYSYFDFNNDTSNLDLYDYRDIKFNVLLTYNNVSVVGEVQMLIKFMLEAKKIGHSVYSFVRNKEYYNEISLFLNKKMNSKEINKIILSQNLSLFSMVLENSSKYDQTEYLMKNKENIVKFLNQSDWKKGLKLFKLFVNRWELE